MEGSGNTVSVTVTVPKKVSGCLRTRRMQMEGSGNAVTEQFLAAICLSSQRTPVQHDTQVDILKETNFSKTF